MEQVLTLVRVDLNGTYSLDVKTHVAQDDTVESALRITGIPRGFPVYELMLDLEPIFTDAMLAQYGPDVRMWFWLAFHVQAPEGVGSSDSRYRGLNVYETNSSRCKRSKYPIPFLGAKRIIENLIRKKRLKPVAVLLWLFWSARGERPV